MTQAMSFEFSNCLLNFYKEKDFSIFNIILKVKLCVLLIFCWDNNNNNNRTKIIILPRETEINQRTTTARNIINIPCNIFSYIISKIFIYNSRIAKDKLENKN